MMYNIKTIYFNQIVFSFLNEEFKLKLVKYNKHLQNILGINLFNYMLLSDRYIVYENKERKIGKEYNRRDNSLLFEGEYLNGKKNGKGKEFYFNGQIKYEGEYLKDLKNGKGKEYYYNGKLYFEGNFLNDKRWSGRIYDEKTDNIQELKNGTGFLKEYDVIRGLIFEGEYLNGKKNGKGKEFYYNGQIKYEGEYLNDKRNGKGKEYYAAGILRFEGDYLNGKRWNGKIYGKNERRKRIY